MILGGFCEHLDSDKDKCHRIFSYLTQCLIFFNIIKVQAYKRGDTKDVNISKATVLDVALADYFWVGFDLPVKPKINIRSKTSKKDT